MSAMLLFQHRNGRILHKSFLFSFILSVNRICSCCVDALYLFRLEDRLSIVRH